jgi:thiamine biosynthesis lipoprotein
VALFGAPACARTEFFEREKSMAPCMQSDADGSFAYIRNKTEAGARGRLRGVRRGVLPDEEGRARVLAAVGWQHVRLDGSRVRFDHPRARLGIAGMAKDRIIDGVFHVLRRAGYEHVIVNIGGDLRTSGRDLQGDRRVFRVPDPCEPATTACRLLVKNSALATSGNHCRFREIAGHRYGHILDPRTGLPPAFAARSRS